MNALEEVASNVIPVVVEFDAPPLTVLTNAVVTWSTEYYSLAVAQLRAVYGPCDEVGGILVYTCPQCREKLTKALGRRRPTE